jgi:hypothetical protein
MGHGTRTTHVTLGAREIAAVRQLIGRVGAIRTHTILGIGRHTVDRVIGGLTVHRATALAVRMALARIGAEEVQP